jgi:hypothetical protein
LGDFQGSQQVLNQEDEVSDQQELNQQDELSQIDNQSHN